MARLAKTDQGGRHQAARLFAEVMPCETCGDPIAERHHVDANPTNNARENIQFLCRRCHMTEDGRLRELSKIGTKWVGVAIAASAQMRKEQPLCKRGHPLSGENLYTSADGRRHYRTCRQDAKRRYEQRLKEVV